MIDLSSLKEQLRLLGHTLPDDQIMNILNEMNIEVAAAEASASQASASTSYNSSMPQTSTHPTAGNASAPAAGQSTGSLLTGVAPTTAAAPAFPAPSVLHHASSNATSAQYLAAHKGDPVLQQLSRDISIPRVLPGSRTDAASAAGMAGTGFISHASYLGGASTGLGVTSGAAPSTALNPTQPHAPELPSQLGPAHSGATAAAPTAVAPKHPHEWYGQLAGKPMFDQGASTAADAGTAASSGQDAHGSRTPTFLSLSSRLGASTLSGSGLKSGARRVALYGPDSDDEEEEGASGEEDDDVAPLPDTRHRGIPRRLGLDQHKVAWGAAGPAAKHGQQLGQQAAATSNMRGAAAAGGCPSSLAAAKGGLGQLSKGRHGGECDEEGDDDECDHEVEQILARYYGAGKASTSSATGAGAGGSLARPLSAASRPLIETVAAAGAGAHAQHGRGPSLSVGGGTSQTTMYAAAAAAAAARGSCSEGGTGRPSGSGGAPANEVPHYGASYAQHSTYTASASGYGCTSQPGGMGAAPRSLLHRVAGGPVPDTRPAARPPKFNWEDQLRSDQAPRPSRAASVSGFSVSTSCASAGGLGGKGRKQTDRVARYSQLQKEWSKDKFLKSTDVTGSAKAGLNNKKAAVASSRKPLNFHTYFKALHAAEAAERDAVIKYSRAKTAYDLSQGSGFIAPSDKRRDALRLEA